MRESNVVRGVGSGEWGVGAEAPRDREPMSQRRFQLPHPAPNSPPPSLMMSRRGGVRMSRRFLCFSVVFLLFAAAWPALADAPGVYAISGGTVHPVSGPPIANGVVIIRDGLIESVGASVPVPLDATVIDVKGSHVYPALIDAQT